MGTTIFDRDELDLIVEFAGCSLDEKPGKNWVEGVGGLPEYICRIARAIKRGGGKTTSQAIAIAVSRVKKWAAGGDDVDADTRAKAAKALAQWESKKARSKAKNAKRGSDTVNASHVDSAVLCLAAAYNVDIVRQAFEARQREARKTWRAANPTGSYDDGPQSLYVKEQWTTHLIVANGFGEGKVLFKIPYTVDEDGGVTFGDAVQVKTTYVVVADSELGDDGTLTDADLKKLMELCGPCPASPVDTMLTLSQPAPTPLQRLVAQHVRKSRADTADGG